MFHFIVFLVAICLSVTRGLCDLVQYDDCANNEIKYIAMSGCSGRLCTIHRGRPLILVSEFTANQDSDTAQIVMTASVGTTTMIVPGIDADGCSNGHMRCPLKKGQTVKFTYNFVIPRMLPLVRSTTTAKLIGEKGVLTCFKMNFNVVDRWGY